MKGQKTEYATVYRVIDICNEILSWILMVILVCLFCYGTYGIGDSYVLEQDAMPQHYEVYRPTEEDALSFEELQAKTAMCVAGSPSTEHMWIIRWSAVLTTVSI